MSDLSWLKYVFIISIIGWPIVWFLSFRVVSGVISIKEKKRKNHKMVKRLLYSKIAEIIIVGMMVCFMLISYIIGWPVDIVVGTEAGILLLLMFKIAVRMNTNKDRK